MMTKTQPADTASIDYPESAAMNALSRYSELIGLPLFCVDATTGTILGQCNPRDLRLIPWEVRRQLIQDLNPQFIELPGGLLCFSLPLPEIEGTPTIAAGYALTCRGGSQVEVVLAAVEQGWSQKDIEGWWETQTFCGPNYLKNLLDTVLQQVQDFEE